MHWISNVTVLGAALAPTASARPACRPDRTTSSVAETTAAAETTIAEAEAISTTGVATTTEGETTTVQGTTITVVQTASAVEAATNTEADTTTTEATATTAAAGPTSLTKNSGFESRGNTAWALQGTEIKNTGLAHSGTHFLQFGVNDGYAPGQLRAGQAVTGLDTNQRYDFLFCATVFSSPVPSRANYVICAIQAVEDDAIMAVFLLDFNTLGSYQPFTSLFYLMNSDFTFNLRLECSDGEKVTLALGVDDITMTKVSS
ncbi:hypothetical protein FVEN_g990 [Fusarium venenatum]|nr:hypothetical protein FVEN_g990 [Fusarium venenatum]